MIALLIGVIMHSIHLSQSLKTFQTLHREIKPMLKEHTLSISNSAKYVDQLRTLMRDVNQIIQTKTPEVQMLKQDLEFMTNRTNQVADYLEKLLQEARVMGIANQYSNRKLDVEDDINPQTTTSHASIKPEKTEQTSTTPNNQKAIIKRLRQKIGQQKPKAPPTKAQQEKSDSPNDADMEKQKKLLEIGQKKIAAQLEKLKSDLEKEKGALTKEEVHNLTQTAKIYENMKPTAAAEIFNKLEFVALVQIIKHMNQKKASAILAAMDPKKARYLTIELLRADQITAPAA